MVPRFLVLALAWLLAALTFGQPTAARDQTAEEAAAMEHMANPKEALLTEDQVKRYIAFLKENKVALKRLGDVQGNPQEVARALAEVDAIPAKYGFNRLGDLIDIRWTIDGIASRYNNQTGEYIDTTEKLKKILAEKIAESLEGKSPDEIAEQRDDIATLKEGIALPRPKMPENIVLVGKYKKEILEGR